MSRSGVQIPEAAPPSPHIRFRSCPDSTCAPISPPLTAQLVDLVMDQAAGDALLDARLRMDVARAAGIPPSTAALQAAIDDAFFTDEYVGYRDMYDYARAIREVLAILRDLLGVGHAETVMSLAEHAIDRAEDAVGYVDDSDGSMGYGRLDPISVQLTTGTFTSVRSTRSSTWNPASTKAAARVLRAPAPAGQPRPQPADRHRALHPLGPRPGLGAHMLQHAHRPIRMQHPPRLGQDVLNRVD